MTKNQNVCGWVDFFSEILSDCFVWQKKRDSQKFHGYRWLVELDFHNKMYFDFTQIRISHDLCLMFIHKALWPTFKSVGPKKLESSPIMYSMNCHLNGSE